MQSTTWDRILKIFSIYRGFSYIPPFCLMAITFYNETEYHFILWPLGTTMVVFGALIRLWGTKHIGRRMPWMKKKGRRLVKTGPYALVRNPLYIGNIIIAGGLSILSELIWIVPMVALYLLIIYHLVVLYEEQKLLARWGDGYRTYMNEIPRWIPRLKNLSSAKAGGFKWKDALRSEAPSLYVGLLAIFIFVLKGFYSHMK